MNKLKMFISVLSVLGFLEVKLPRIQSYFGKWNLHLRAFYKWDSHKICRAAKECRSQWSSLMSNRRNMIYRLMWLTIGLPQRFYYLLVETILILSFSRNPFHQWMCLRGYLQSQSLAKDKFLGKNFPMPFHLMLIYHLQSNQIIILRLFSIPGKTCHVTELREKFLLISLHATAVGRNNFLWEILGIRSREKAVWNIVVTWLKNRKCHLR